MTTTDFAFSVIRDWMVGNTITAPSGMIMGTGSDISAFSDTLLGSPLDPTRHAFSSSSGLDTFRCEWEYLVASGDITTGSRVREIGMIAQSGGNVWFRANTPAITLDGSVDIINILQMDVF